MPFATAITLLVRITVEESAFRATVTRGRTSESIPFAFPLTDEEIEAWLARPYDLIDPKDGTEGHRKLVEVGDKLFTAIFDGPTLRLYRESYDLAEKRKAMLRIVLDLPAEAHYALPWEGLHDRAASRFLGTDSRMIIVRLIPDEDEPPSRRAHEPLRVLAVTSAPAGWDRLEGGLEYERLERALGPLIGQGRVLLSRFERPRERTTLGALAETLNTAAARGEPYDLLHYIGHARYSPRSGEGELILEDEAGQARPMSGIEIAQALRDSGVSLVLLNACEGARAERLAFRSVAAELVRRANIPLAIANQTVVRDRTAIAFAERFYGSIAEHASVEEALLWARRAVALRSLDTPEWATSVFFTRYPDRPATLLPSRTDKIRTWLIRITLLLLMLAVGISTFSLVRHFGVMAGFTLQVGFLSLVGAMGFLLLGEVRRQLRALIAVAVLATVLVLAFFVWQPTVPAVAPPPGFALTIEEPPRAPTAAELPVTPLTVRVAGTVANMPPGHHLWILVRVHDGSTFAVGGEATVTGDRFVAPNVIVGPISTLKLKRRPYVLQPVLVDEEGHAEMIQHGLQRWRIFHPDFNVAPAPTLPTVHVLRE